MTTNTRRSRGFTLIELLVVVLILGILLAIAIPAYLSSVTTAKSNTAMSNAHSIATAVQSTYVQSAGVDAYNAAPLSTCAGTVLTDLGGVVPNNPCDPADVGLAGYDLTASTATHYSILPKNTQGCTVSAVTLN